MGYDQGKAFLTFENDPFNESHDVIITSPMAITEVVHNDNDNILPLAILFVKFIMLGLIVSLEN